jgi:hypothetical protein
VIAELSEETFNSRIAINFVPYLTEVAKFSTESI